MEYKEFLCRIRKCVEELCDNETKVSLHQVKKNNSMTKDALLIQKEGESVAPTIYLDSFYENYLNGEDVYEIAERIIAIYEENNIHEHLNPDDLFEYENIKKRIIFKLINTEKNTELLQTLPHRQLNNLSIIYCLFLDGIFGDYATTIINNFHIMKWNLTENDLFRLAYDNTIEICNKEFRTMNEIMVDMLMSDGISEDLRESILLQLESDNTSLPMYVLTNKYRLFGASLIIYDDILKDISDKIGDFYIIPSSIHEVIIIPVSSGMDEEHMSGMVGEVNATQVAYDEVLSDNIYLYNNDTGINMINRDLITTHYIIT